MTWNSKLSDFLNKSQMDEILPNGTCVFVGINLVKEDGKWTQKGAFAKVQSMGKAVSKKTKEKITNESSMFDDLNNSSNVVEDSGF